MAIRSQLEIDTIIGNGQDTLGDLAYDYVVYKKSGTFNQYELKDKTYRLTLLSEYLDAVIDPDTEGIRPYLLLAQNEVKFNKLLDGIYKLSDIFDIPGVPITGRRKFPLIIANLGQTGPQGAPGQDGTDANIVVESDPDFDNISVIETNVGGIKTYKLGYSPYIAPQASITIQGSKVIEIGDVVETLTIYVISTRGRELIIRREIVSPPGIVLANPGINNPGPQQENVLRSNVSVTTTYVLEVEDEYNEIVSSSDTITFVYPFLSGDTLTDTIDYYQDLDKLIAAKSNKTIVFNGTNKFFWFGYPASYGSLSRIKDQNGFDVTGEFDVLNVNVNSANLDNNWTNVAYKFYKTKVKTTINSSPYTFEF